MLVLVICLLITYVVSRLQVLENVADIRLAKFGEVDHYRSHTMHMTWSLVRLVMFVGIGVLLWRVGHFTWWIVAIAMVLWNFGYSYVLRTELNKAMKWPKNYLGGTAWYDAFWIHLKTPQSIKETMTEHQGKWNDTMLYPEYVAHVLGRGALASRVELVLSAVGLGILLLDHYV